MLTLMTMAFLQNKVKYFQPFLKLQYPLENGLYSYGILDLCTVYSLILILLSIRFILRCTVFPVLGMIVHIEKASEIEQRKFKEQLWVGLYYFCSFVWGVYTCSTYQPNFYFNTKYLWVNYPVVTRTLNLKLYYLTEMAYYLSMIIVVSSETRRKDYNMYIGHHLVTSTLIGLSYFMNFIEIGISILITMDPADILLPFAKVFRYIGYFKVSDWIYTVFFCIIIIIIVQNIVTWFFTRHVIFFKDLWSVYSEAATATINQVYNPALGNFFDLVYVKWTFLILLSAIQILQLIWFWEIASIAKKVVFDKEEIFDGQSEDEDVKDIKKD